MNLDNSALFLIISIVASIVVAIIQYYGLPLLDHFSYLLWRGLRNRIEKRKARTAAEYEALVQMFMDDRFLPPWSMVCDTILILIYVFFLCFAFLVLIDFLILAHVSDNPVYDVLYVMAGILTVIIMWNASKMFRRMTTNERARDEAEAHRKANFDEKKGATHASEN